MNGYTNHVNIPVQGDGTWNSNADGFEPNILVRKGNDAFEESQKPIDYTAPTKRDAWGSDLEFLMSCIALSVGLGNVWRFPFAALDNGGGAFLIPYLVVLVVVGKPLYYLEMILGQFSSRGSIQVYDFAPALRGIGYGQVLATAMLTTYYASLLAVTLRYFVASFQASLPWSQCNADWNVSSCIDSTIKLYGRNDSAGAQLSQTSAELYFYKEVLKETSTIHDGIGVPDWKLLLCLAFAWLCIGTILFKGIKSSGKTSYFLALFPYVTMGVLLVRAVTLPGSMKGIMYFLTPQWDQLLNPKVWFAAVSQVFFSISVCLGLIIMFASFNRFDQNIYRDALIVTSLDTVTSVLSGIIIFGILGNLAHETGVDDITAVVKGGTGLAFVSYPDAIAKFEFVPQIFSVVFFFMLFVLGIGSNVGLCVCLTSVVRDRFTNVTHMRAILMVASVQFAIGCLYVTPGGQYLLNLVDYFGVALIIYVLAIGELIAVGWVYGVKRLCQDIEFMMGLKTSWYWRICWAIITPGLMITILVYQIVTMQPMKYNGYVYPTLVYAIGWILSMCGILQLPIWMGVAVYRQSGKTTREKFRGAFRPLTTWGPADVELRLKYKQFMDVKNEDRIKSSGLWNAVTDNIFG